MRLTGAVTFGLLTAGAVTVLTGAPLVGVVVGCACACSTLVGGWKK
jgi:hypothetical protein